MKVLAFPTPNAVRRVRLVPRPRTHCEACGAPTVRPVGAEPGTVRLCCDSCAHVWSAVDRRESVRHA